MLNEELTTEQKLLARAIPHRTERLATTTVTQCCLFIAARTYYPIPAPHPSNWQISKNEPRTSSPLHELPVTIGSG